MSTAATVRRAILFSALEQIAKHHASRDLSVDVSKTNVEMAIKGFAGVPRRFLQNPRSRQRLMGRHHRLPRGRFDARNPTGGFGRRQASSPQNQTQQELRHPLRNVRTPWPSNQPPKPARSKPPSPKPSRRPLEENPTRRSSTPLRAAARSVAARNGRTIATRLEPPTMESTKAASTPRSCGVVPTARSAANPDEIDPSR